jgi:tetratricopeptide (TPR) repeat protein
MSSKSILTCLVFAALALLSAEAGADAAARLVEEIGVARQGANYTVTVLFGCTVRYVSHTPADAGDVLHVRVVPGADCGSPATGWVIPPPVDERGVIRRVTANRSLGNDVDLAIQWTAREQYMLVPAFRGRGLRILLIRPDTRVGKVTVSEAPNSGVRYAVNLDASKEPFDAAAIAAASAATGFAAYVSETDVDGEHWYRLRAGPFLTQQDAREVLNAARRSYPKAWVAVADDSTTTELGVTAAAGRAPTVATPGNATLLPAEIDKTLQQAQEAMRRKDYPKAIQLLTILTQQPEFPQRAQALEMLGLARERSGQLAHAKAEYEEYLRTYPNGEGAARVKTRLNALMFAASPASRQAAGSSDAQRWRVYGGFSQTYLHDTSKVDSGSLGSSSTTQSALLNDVALAVRKTGERYDFAARMSGAYGLDFGADSSGSGNQATVALLSAEIQDRVLDWSARIGRQSGTLGGIIGTFDGLSGGYQITDTLRLNAYLGYPVDTTQDTPSSDRTFYAISADLGTFADAWDFSIYALDQSYYGYTDRRAVGTEVRYFRPGLNFLGLVDYDIEFGDLNDVLLLGTIALPDRWTMSFNLDHRHSPGLSLRNAMIGQPVTSFDQLFDLYPQTMVEQLARDRTATVDSYTVSVQRPFGERWQWSADASGITMSATPASGGVDETDASGTDLIFTSQMMGYGLFGRGDVTSLGLQYQTGQTTDTISAGMYLQLPIGDVWRLTPRLRVDDRKYHADNSKQLLWSPALRAEMRWGRMWLEFEGGAEIGQRDFASASTDTTRYFFTAGYRYDF